MKVLQSNLAAYVTASLLAVKRGCFDAYKNGDLVLRLPAKIDFQVEVVCADAYNTIVRTNTTTPAGDKITTTVDAAYTETTTTTPAADRVTTMVDSSFSETTTHSPATTQTDDSSQGGADVNNETTTYTEFNYTTSP